MLIERWRRHYNAVRPHSSLGYRPPAPETILPPVLDLSYAALRPAPTLANERRILTYELVSLGGAGHFARFAKLNQGSSDPSNPLGVTRMTAYA